MWWWSFLFLDLHHLVKMSSRGTQSSPQDVLCISYQPLSGFLSPLGEQQHTLRSQTQLLLYKSCCCFFLQDWADVKFRQPPKMKQTQPCLLYQNSSVGGPRQVLWDFHTQALVASHGLHPGPIYLKRRVCCALCSFPLKSTFTSLILEMFSSFTSLLSAASSSSCISPDTAVSIVNFTTVSVLYAAAQSTIYLFFNHITWSLEREFYVF